MASNEQRAAELIREWGGDPLHPDQAAEALYDAGLLMPDLPEPKRYPDGSLEWHTIYGYVNIEPGEPLVVSHDERDSEISTPSLDPDPGEIIITKSEYVTALACFLLAAAHHMEKNE